MSHTHRYHGNRLRAGRWSERGRVYLITAVTRGRAPIFADWPASHACARSLHGAPRQVPVTSVAWVVMPDHVHWLFTLEGPRLDRVVQSFKSRAARAVNAALGRTGPVWQSGYHDRAVRADEDVHRLSRYVVANPVRAGLCERVGDYPFWDAAWL